MKYKFVFFILMSVILIFFSGCASTQIATGIGKGIGSSFQKSAEVGGISAEKSIKAWPYVSGQIKGIFADDFEMNIPIIIQNIMANLDELAKNNILTEEDKGKIIGYFVRLEILTVNIGLDKYGVSIYDLVVNFIK
ncbi:MAG: hypothetical protein WC143_07470 [Eubacteriales bacterium]